MKKINSLQFCTSFIALLTSSFLGMGIYCIVKSCKVDSIISILISSIICFLFIIIFLKIFNYNINDNLKLKIDNLFNKPLNYIITSILSICFLILISFFTYDINDFITSQFLSETPAYIIGIVFGFLVIYINNKGIEVITRVSTILFFFNIILFILTFIGEINLVKLDNLKPILENGLTQPLKGIIYITSLTMPPALSLLIISKNNIVKNDYVNKLIIISYILCFTIFSIVTYLVIGIQGINLTSIYQYPIYIVMKRVSLFGFLDRIENFLIMQWFFDIYIAISLMIYFINKMTNIKTYILVIISLLLTLIFKNNTIFNEYTYEYLPYISSIIILIFLIIYFKIVIKKRKINLSKHNNI